MKKLAARVAWVTYLALLMSFMVVAPASAYLDPGSGSIIFQVVVGALMAGSLAIKVFWRRITSLFKRKEPQDKS